MAFVAEDGDARRGTVSQVAQLNFDLPAASRRCNATIVMMDDRRHVPLANNSKDIGYFHKAMMLNLLYAQRHGMSFLIVRPTAAVEDSWLDGGASGLCPAWCRVKILASLVASRLAAHGCHWVLYIDSDAYIREQHVDLLERLDTPANRDVHFAFAREELPAGGFRSPRKRSHGVRVPSLNAGVLFVRASAWSARLLAVWMRAAQQPVCAPFRQQWPCEQQCLHELLRNRSLLPGALIATDDLPCMQVLTTARSNSLVTPRGLAHAHRKRPDAAVQLAAWPVHPARVGRAGRRAAPPRL